MTDQNAIGAASTKKAAKRTKWTAEQRQGAVVASLVAGASINEVAERFGVNPSLLSTWRRKHAAAIVSSKPAKKPARFAAVRVRSIPTDGFIEIDLATRCVRVHGIVDAGMLREVLAATR
jgi:Transposase